MKIEDKPLYCHAWVSKLSDKVMCNSIPCCGFSCHGKVDKIFDGFKDKDKVGRHPLVNGKFVFDDGTIHDPNRVSGPSVSEVEYVFDGYKYTFSNLDLKEVDKVYPISDGRSDSDKGTYEHVSFDFEDFTIEEPHIILDLKHSDYKPYEIRTSFGYGPREKYYKITKKEKI